MFSPFSFLVVPRRVSAQETPFLVSDDANFIPPLSLPLPMIVEAGGAVGGFALVTTRPIVDVFYLLFCFFLRMIFKCVGLVMLRKYCGFLHQNWFSFPFSQTRLPPAVAAAHLPENCCSIVLGNQTSSIGSDENTLKKNGLSSSFLEAAPSVLGMTM